jgi:hypothetical protein
LLIYLGLLSIHTFVWQRLSVVMPHLAGKDTAAESVFAGAAMIVVRTALAAPTGMNSSWTTRAARRPGAATKREATLEPSQTKNCSKRGEMEGKPIRNAYGGTHALQTDMTHLQDGGRERENAGDEQRGDGNSS